jgi:redox-sensing transcriptional repressor
VALVDVDPEKVGRTSRNGIPVVPYGELAAIVRQKSVDIAIIAVTSDAAQQVYDDLSAAGVNAILNFAPMQIRTQEGVKLKSVDLRINLESLSFYLKGVEDGTA